MQPSRARWSSIRRVPARWSLSTQAASSGPLGSRPSVTTGTARAASAPTIGSSMTGSTTMPPSSGRRASVWRLEFVGSSVSAYPRSSAAEVAALMTCMK